MDRKNFFKVAGILSAVPILKPVDSYAMDMGAKSASFNVLACNIRVALDEDEVKGYGWASRKQACLEIIKRQKPDVIGFQEVLKGQFLDLKAGLKDFHGLNFDGPEMDAHKEGYHGIAKNPIFFSKKRFELIAAGGYWLSETPLVAGSKSWDTARARNASWVRLHDKVTKKEFRLLNLHLDHVSKKAKVEQTKVVLKEAAQYQDDFPQILVGDFNASHGMDVIKEVLSSGWRDSFKEVNGDIDPGPSVHVFLGPEDPKRNVRKKIDFIFLKGNVVSQSSEMIRDSYKGIYPSDHYFLKAQVSL